MPRVAKVIPMEKNETDTLLFDALEALRGAVAILDTSATKVQGALRGTQRDMFGNPVASSGGAVSTDAARIEALATLDRAIVGLENVLGEDSTTPATLQTSERRRA